MRPACPRLAGAFGQLTRHASTTRGIAAISPAHWFRRNCDGICATLLPFPITCALLLSTVSMNGAAMWLIWTAGASKARHRFGFAGRCRSRSQSAVATAHSRSSTAFISERAEADGQDSSVVSPVRAAKAPEDWRPSAVILWRAGSPRPGGFSHGPGKREASWRVVFLCALPAHSRTCSSRSWSQCAQSWRSKLPMNPAAIWLNLECGGKQSATPLWLCRSLQKPEPKRRRRCALPGHFRTCVLPVHGFDSRPNLGGSRCP